MRRLGRAAHLVVTVSSASKDYYVQLGIPEHKILVLPNGVSSQLLKRGIELARAHPPFSDSRLCTIGFVGSLSRWHRVDFLLQALSNLEDHYRVTIVGYGAEYARLRALAESLGVAERVSWLGALPHDKAFQEIAKFDVAVLPGTLPTGAPIKLLEYAALARPIVAPDLPNLRELFGSGEICFVPPETPQALADAIRSLHNLPEKARQLGRAAQERVRKYTWERLVQKLLGALSETLAP
nr:glycosyltransferase [Ammonifex thiophilus]